MANGQLPGSVAPTQIGQGKSYSEMVADQLGLIQRQRAANLQQRLAQDEKNREFRTQQLQNIYDFDVTGLASGDVKVLSEIQKRMADSLNPDSDQSYSDSRQLIQDISQLNNLYGYMKQWGQSRAAGSQSYSQLVAGQAEVGNGMMFTGSEETLSKRNDVWEQGAFANVDITGGPGGWQITGDVLDPSGNVIETGVDFMQNSMRNRAEEFWRPEVTASTPYLETVAADYLARTYVDPNKVSATAGEIFDADIKIENRIRQDLYRELANSNPGIESLDEMSEASLKSHGLDRDTIRGLYVAQAKIGVGLQKRDVKPTPGVFSGNMIATASGLGGYEINPERPFELTSGELMGNEIRGLAINNNGDFVVTYMSGGQPVEEVVKIGTPDHRNIVKHIGSGGVEALTTIRGMGGQGVQETDGEPESNQYTLEERTAERDRLVEALGEKFKEETGEDLSSYINTDSEPIEGRINVVSSLNNPDSVEGLYDIFMKEYKRIKMLESLPEERERQEREGIAPSIIGPKFEGGGIIPRVRRFFGA